MLKDVDFHSVGNLIRLLRERQALSQDELANKFSVTKAAISQWESGGGIKTEKLFEIAEFFDISVTELVAGKLNSKSEENFYSKQYDLKKHENFNEINELNIDSLKNYLKCCKCVIVRFMDLLPKYINNKLEKKHAEEFFKLYKYFNFDDSYLFDIGEFLPREEIVKKIYDNSNLTKDEIDYEVSKIIELKLDVDTNAIFNFGDEESIKLLLDVLSMTQKNALFSKYLDDNKLFILTNPKIENDLVVRLFVNDGAHALYDVSKLHREINCSLKDLDGVEGIIVKNMAKFVAEEIINNLLKANKNLKSLSLSEYKSIYNEYTTERIKSIVNLKDKDPLSYLNYLIAHDRAILNKS